MTKATTQPLDQIISINSNRLKWYTWSEIFSFTHKTPTELINSEQCLNFPIIDPSLWLTQSAKNYNSVGLETMITNYSNPLQFQPVNNNYGLSNKITLSYQSPLWAKFVHSNSWFWSQHNLLRYIQWLYILPTITSIYSISSVNMRISKPNSDLDLVILCQPGTVLITRLLTKLMLKTLGWDVHPFRYELALWLARSLHFLNSVFSLFPGFVGRQIKLNQIQNQIQNQITKHKHEYKIRIDAGIFGENENQIYQYYGVDPRQSLWLWGGAKLHLSPKSVLNSSFLFTGGLFQFRLTTAINPILALKLILIVVSLLLYPISLLQLPLYYLKNGKNPNFVYKFDFMGFIPRIYKDGYFKKM